MSERLENTIAAVRKLGIDPNMISVDGLNIEGYWEVILVNGQKALDDKGNIQVIWREWVSMEDALSVLEPYLIEMHERGEL